MVGSDDDTFRPDRFVNGAILTTVIAVPLAFVSTTIGVVVLVAVTFVCARFGGRDAGLGSWGAGTFMFFWAATEPHFELEIAHTSDVVLLVVCFFGSLASCELGVRRRRHLQARRVMDAQRGQPIP